MEKTFASAFFSYEFIDQIGCGGGGVVYKVKRMGDDSTFALKLININQDKENAAEKLARFKNEFFALLSCNHPNIIRVLDSGKFADQLFYVMPLAQYSLKEIIGKAPAHLCNSIAVKLIKGLEYLHKKSIVHRDLKPENILLIDEEPVICDLGIAHLLPEQQISDIKTESGRRMANFRYASPEQRSKNPTVAPTMDIYSLGIIIHELFTGEFIQGKGTQTIASRYPEYGYWDSIVDKCIKNAPEQRFSSAEELLDCFELYKWKIKFRINDLCSEAEHFAYDRFAKAFPEACSKQEFRTQEEIWARLKELLRPPYKMGEYDCMWWTKGNEDNPIDKYIEDETEKLLYIGPFECDIQKIISLNFYAYYKNCVYVELKPQKPLLASEAAAGALPQSEEFAKYDGRIFPVQTADAGYFWDNNKCVEIDSEKLVYVTRFLQKSNFLILSRQNSVIQRADKDTVATILQDILCNKKTICDLYNFIESLPKPRFY